MKLNDNELVECWNNSSNRNNKSHDSYFEEKFLKLTNKLDIKDGKIVNTREIEENIYLSLVYKEIIETNCVQKIYSFVMFNMSPSLPPEVSRITKYCLFKSNEIDVLEDIINFRIKQIMESINVAIDEKFKNIFYSNFKTLKHRFGKELVDIIVKPPRIEDSPSIKNILDDIPKIIQEKKNKIELIEYDINKKERELIDRELLISQKEKNIQEKELSLAKHDINHNTEKKYKQVVSKHPVFTNNSIMDDFKLII
jgi:hypothetical protein